MVGGTRRSTTGRGQSHLIRGLPASRLPTIVSFQLNTGTNFDAPGFPWSLFRNHGLLKAKSRSWGAKIQPYALAPVALPDSVSPLTKILSPGELFKESHRSARSQSQHAELPGQIRRCWLSKAGRPFALIKGSEIGALGPVCLGQN